MDFRLISEFDGAGQAGTEWLEKLDVAYRLRGAIDLENVVLLRLTGGACTCTCRVRAVYVPCTCRVRAMYQQLSNDDKGSYGKIKTTLTSAFAVDKFIAY